MPYFVEEGFLPSCYGGTLSVRGAPAEQFLIQMLKEVLFRMKLIFPIQAAKEGDLHLLVLDAHLPIRHLLGDDRRAVLGHAAGGI